jgi:hypothetical protein
VILNCPQCAAEIAPNSINVVRLVARCSQCNTAFSFVDKLDPIQQRKLGTSKPSRVKVNNLGGALTLQWRWLSWDLFFLLLMFTVVWNAIIFSMFVALLVKRIQEGDGSSAFWFFLFPHFWGGLILIYLVFAAYLNNTTITLKNGLITICHDPLPWTGNKRLNMATIRQLYVKKYKRVGRHRGIWIGNYDLYAIIKREGHVRLLTGLESPEHALFVRQMIEECLGIEGNIPAEGEYGR